MKVLTAAEVRDVDRRTMELGISGPVLMENAGHRAVEFLVERFGALTGHRIVVLCGKGNNGGDGYVVARQLATRFRVASLHVVAAFPDDVTEPRRMLEAVGCPVHSEITREMRHASIVVDAVLGTGVSGAARGRALEFIREINDGFPQARVFAVDVPSGMNTDSGISEGEVARADATITFTAPKLCHVLSPNCERIGAWRVGHIGSHASLMEDVRLHLLTPEYFRHVLAPRRPESNKGTYGHVLVVGGAEGKAGAAEMAGIAALRAGTGLVTVACSSDRLRYPELMTARLDNVDAALANRDVAAIGPGLGIAPDLALRAASDWAMPVVIDADGLNSLAGRSWRSGKGLRVLTPHPGEMARLAGCTVAEVQRDRIGAATAFASKHDCCVVLKGHRTVVAFADGRAWVNPTGTPGMATGGSGDILTGLIAGLLAQSPEDAAVLAAVWLHGRAGELGSADHGEHGLIATDLLDYLPEAIRDSRNVSNEL